jgi:TolA-binding protein
MLFGARRYAEARSAYQDLQRLVSGDERELVDLRVAECDFYLKRYQSTRDGLRPYLDRASRKAEARFFDLSAVRELGDDEQFVAMTRAFVQEFPDSSWSEEALSNLGSHYIISDEDEAAARTFRELYEKFPSGQRAERAAWKYGWWSYQQRQYAETIRIFEQVASAFPRSDYRPSFLYWAARSHGKLESDRGRGTAAPGSCRLRNHYGRLSDSSQRARLPVATSPSRHSRLRPPTPGGCPPNRSSASPLAVGYDDALNELRYAQRVGGTSTKITTIAGRLPERGSAARDHVMRRVRTRSTDATGRNSDRDPSRSSFR